MIQTVDFRIGRYLIPVHLCMTHNRIFFKFGYNPKIMDEIKSMAGPQWHDYDGAPHRELAASIFGTSKIWSVLDNHRNRFQLDYLQGKNPYANWDQELLPLTPTRPLREHQIDLTASGLTYHYNIWAAEMGTGKTLSAIELMEQSGVTDWWYIAPKSALMAVEDEFRKWDLKIKPKLMTYNKLVTEMKQWPEGQLAPQGVFLDESQKVKTPTAMRSEAALALAEGVRDDHGMNGYVILMSGSPAPKAPTDFWHQCEIAYPGFLKEGTFNKFKFRLGLHESKDGFAGGSFMQRVTWLDDERKCALCGKFEDDINHSRASNIWHEFKPSINEVAKLYRRMKGLVIVKFKKDCVDLPDKQYRLITCKPLPSTIRAAKLIAQSSSTTAQALIKLRELSDGFQYVETQTGEETCPLCDGSGQMDDFEIKPDYAEQFEEHGIIENTDGLGEEAYRERYFDRVRTTCSRCAGNGQVPKYTRDVQRVPCPKDDVFRDILDEHDDVGRLVVYAGFEGSVNRCVEVALSEKWAVIKWDGKGIKIYDSEGQARRPLSQPASDGRCVDADGSVHPLSMFQKGHEEFPKVVFIGNAGAAGTGLTLTASPSILYYSNSFNAEDRIQSEDRIHRIGMDENRGATIIDISHLPTDKYILTNLQDKKKLQDLAMSGLMEVFEEEDSPELLIKVRHE